MSKTKDISPDNYQTYMIELMVANQRKILKEFERLNKRIDQMEECVGMSYREKNKPIFYATEQVMEILNVSRNTLLNYRKKGILSFTKVGKKILYSIDDINKIRDLRNKTA